MIAPDGYTDLVPIGHGGLGDVYRATRVATGDTVAIKVLRDVRDTGDEALAWHRIQRELSALRALAGHDHVVRIVDALRLPEGPALVMEYAPGGSVADLLRARGGTLSVAEAVLVGRHTAAALVAAHEQGIVHRDVKPPNLLVAADGRVRLCDFGVAALTRSDEFRTRTSALSMRYASPEDLDEGDVGPPTDVYSLGATLLHLVHGAPPTLRDRMVRWQPPFTDDPERAAVDAVIAACLDPDPAARPSAATIRDELERVEWLLSERCHGLDGVGPTGDATSARPAPALGDVRVLGAAPGAAPGSGDLRIRSLEELLDDDAPAPVDDADRVSPDPAMAGAADGVTGPPPRAIATPVRPAPPALSREAWLGIGAAAAILLVVAGVIFLWPGREVSTAGTGDTLTPATAATPASTAVASDAPATTPPTPAGPAEPAGASGATTIAFASRPAGLAPVDDPSVIWPFGDPGECLVQVPGWAELESVPCSEPHDLQRFAVAHLDRAVYPIGVAYDREALEQAVASACEAAFSPFAGVAADESIFDVPFTLPSPTTWDAGDRRYQCLVGLPGRRTVGDATGASR